MTASAAPPLLPSTARLQLTDDWADTGRAVVPVAQHDAGPDGVRRYLPKGIVAKAFEHTDVVFLSIRCGGGKTTVFKDYLVAYLAANPGARVVVMSANRTYAWWVTNELTDLGFRCYMDKGLDPAVTRRLVVSLESIVKGMEGRGRPHVHGLR